MMISSILKQWKTITLLFLIFFITLFFTQGNLYKESSASHPIKPEVAFSQRLLTNSSEHENAQQRMRKEKKLAKGEPKDL